MTSAAARPAWQPTGPPLATSRFRWWVRLGLGPVMAVILAGLVVAVVDAVRSGHADTPFRDSGIHNAGVVAGWVVVAVIGAALLTTGPVVWLFRVEFWPDGFVARAYVRRYPVALAEFTELGVSRRRQNPYDPVPETPFLRVRARDAAGRRRGFVVTRKYQQVDAALRVVDDWVRARPDLVTGELAQRVFAARGVVPQPGPDGRWTPVVRHHRAP